MDFSRMDDLKPGPFPGNDPGTIWTRVREGLKQDPLASMLADHTRQGLAMAVMEMCAPEQDQGWTVATDPGALYTGVLLDVLRKSPLAGVLTTEASCHLAEVARDSVFPASARTREVLDAMREQQA